MSGKGLRTCILCRRFKVKSACEKQPIQFPLQPQSRAMEVKPVLLRGEKREKCTCRVVSRDTNEEHL